MSMVSPVGSTPGEVVASFPQYERAQKAVSELMIADIPAREIAIVGHGIRSVERITGRLGYAAAARGGAVNGLFIGLLISVVFSFGGQSFPIQAFLGALLLGVALGMLLNLLFYSLARRRRDYSSVMQVVAERYDVTVLPTSVHRAREVLGTPPSQKPAPPPSDEPPQFGERITQPPAD